MSLSLTQAIDVPTNRKSKLEEAILQFSEVLKQDPEPEIAYEALVRRGFAYTQLCRHKEAKEDLDKAIGLDATKADAHRFRGVLSFINGEYVEAIKDLTVVIDSNAPHYDELIMRANAKTHLGKFGDAFNDLESAKNLNPKDHFLWLSFGLLYIQKGDFELSLSCLEMSIKLNPDSPMVYALLGDAFRGLGNHNDARKRYEECLKLITHVPMQDRQQSHYLTAVRAELGLMKLDATVKPTYQEEALREGILTQRMIYVVKAQIK